MEHRLIKKLFRSSLLVSSLHLIMSWRNNVCPGVQELPYYSRYTWNVAEGAFPWSVGFVVHCITARNSDFPCS